MAKKSDQVVEPVTETVEHVDLESVLGTSYIDYAMSVIVARAIPDVRDGMKPVQRRIMYSMHRMGLTHNVAFKKCATTVGDVLGHYHPHGDSSVYDALARMAQDFSMRYILVDGHGNFGSMDGDPPAAYRYTESRMSRLSEELLRDIDKNTVDWTPNFDGSVDEPTVLTSRFPNLLVNGASGIAVGMSCNIPPHNLGEIIDATTHIIDNDIKDKDTSIEKLINFVKGPDFPTGGVILGDGYKDVYRTGKGSVVLQGTYEIEEDKKKSRIVFTSVPYQVNKAELVGKIAKYSKDNKLEVSDVRDETNRDGVRIVIDLKRGAVPELVVNNLLEHTSLRSSFSANMLCIVDGRPMTLNLLQMLEYYLEHQKDVVFRRTVYEKDRAEKRKHVVEGLIKATDHIDEIIKIIRASETSDEAKEKLVVKFKFSDIQAQTILDLRLKALTGLERQKLEEELKTLIETIDNCTKVLTDEKELLKLIKKELKDVKKRYADERKTGYQEDYSNLTAEDLIKDDPCIIIRTNLGYLKRLKPDTFRTQKRGGKGSHVATVLEDYVKDMITTSLLSDIIFFTNFGRIYSMKAYQILETTRTARGTAIAGVLTKLKPGEEVTGMITEREYSDDRSLLIVTKKGIVKRVAMSEFANVRTNGLFMIKLDEGDEVCGTVVVEENDSVMLLTRNGYCLAYPVSFVRKMGRQARGSRGVKLEEGDEVAVMVKKEPKREVLLMSQNGYAKRLRCSDFRSYKNKTSKGVHCLAKDEKVATAFFIEDITDDVIVTTEDGQIIRTPIEKLPVYSRQARGVRMLNLSNNPNGVIVDIAATAHEEPVEEEELEDEED